MKFVMFVGRWQPCHQAHIALWKAGAWDHGLPALIYVRDILPNERNPFTTRQTVELIEAALSDVAEAAPPVDISPLLNTKVMVGPNIAAVRYGRGVGYLVEEVHLSEEIQGISATEIRKRMKSGLPGWRDFVTPGVAKLLEEMDWDNLGYEAYEVYEPKNEGDL